MKLINLIIKNCLEIQIRTRFFLNKIYKTQQLILKLFSFANVILSDKKLEKFSLAELRIRYLYYNIKYNQLLHFKPIIRRV